MLHYIEPTLETEYYDNTTVHVGVNNLLNDKLPNKTDILTSNRVNIVMKCKLLGAKKKNYFLGSFYPFFTNVFFLIPLKTYENVSFLCFQGDQKRTVDKKGLIKYSHIHLSRRQMKELKMCIKTTQSFLLTIVTFLISVYMKTVYTYAKVNVYVARNFMYVLNNFFNIKPHISLDIRNC